MPRSNQAQFAQLARQLIGHRSTKTVAKENKRAMITICGKGRGKLVK
jgi:hypothetical protein